MYSFCEIFHTENVKYSPLSRVKTVREAKKRKAGEDITTTEPQPKKPKKLFHTAHKASVIVQSETARLTKSQITSALREALDQAGGYGERQSEKPMQ
jgi:hypothetical protein